MLRAKYISLFALLFFTANICAFAQINVVVQEFSGTPTGLNTTVLLKATRNNTVIPLSTKNVFVREAYIRTDGNTQQYWGAAASLVETASNGFYKVRWDSKERIPQFLVVDNGETGVGIPEFPVGAGGRLIDLNSPPGTFVQEVKFDSDLNPSRQIFIRAPIGIEKVPGKQNMVDLDSLTFRGDGFTQEWIGNYFYPVGPPPNSIFSPISYEVTVRLKDPSDKSYKRDVFTVHYEGGGKEFIHLIANKFPISTRTLLTVLSPQPREILTPCEEFQIKWQGSIKDIPTYVHYSTDGGKTWEFIGESNDSTYSWKVPDIPTDSLVIRVHQKLSKTEDVQLVAEKSGINALGFNSTGTKFLSAYANGKLVEWDAQTFLTIKTYNAFAEIISAGFSSKSNTVVAATRNGIHIFANGSTNATKSTVFPGNFTAKSVAIIDEHELMVAIPETGAIALLYNANTGNFIRQIKFDAPLSAFAASQDNKTGAFALLDGRIVIVNLPDFTSIETISIPFVPLVSRFTISADGKFIALATEISAINVTEIHVVDVATQQIVRTHYNNGSPAIGLTFSPNNKFLVVGFQDLPHISIWDIPNDEFMPGVISHATTLSAVLFSPDGRFVISSSIDTKENFKATKFSFPETDIIDSAAFIVRPTIESEDIVVAPLLLGTERDTLITATICNKGQRPVVFESARMEIGESFRINRNFGLGDTLFPNQCMNIPITFMPKDTGIIGDKIIFKTCASEYIAKIQGFSRNRNISFPSDNTDFGNICVSSTKDFDIIILKNNDSIPLHIDSVGFENIPPLAFSFVSDLRGTVVQPGQSINAIIRFSPRFLGRTQGKAIIYHSGVVKVIAMFNVAGTGSGADVRSDMNVVPFIPELPQRNISFKNYSGNPIQFDTASLSSDEHFSISTKFPLPLPSQKDTSITVVWDAQPTGNTQLLTKISPCATEHDITLTMYSGTSSLSIPSLIEAGPMDRVVIPVTFQNTENYPYNGERFFEGELIVNAHLFIADSVSTQYGTAKILSQNVSDGKRSIRFRIEGNFPLNGVVAEIHGVPGLAEEFSTPLEWKTDATYWGRAVTMAQFTNGELRIRQIHGQRKFVHKNLSVMSISPNPVQDFAEIKISSDYSGTARMEIYDALGKEILSKEIELKEGINAADLAFGAIPSGSYRLVVRSGDAVVAAQIMVTR